MEVVKSTDDDVAQILGWLEKEYHQDGEGFWVNRNIVSGAHDDHRLYVVRDKSKAVGFQVGDFSASILSVKQDNQRMGIGKALVAASIKRARRADVTILRIECEPRTSLPFWQTNGFQRYGDMREFSKITARLILEKSFELPNRSNLAKVEISFYSEEVLYSKGKSISPIVTYALLGSRIGKDRIVLERRIIAPEEICVSGDDLVVGIELDGISLCLCKAKYAEAEHLGAQRDEEGRAFYIDSLTNYSNQKS